MASPTSVPLSTPIAQLNPQLEPDESSVTGIVTLIWPYASSKKTFSLLLVEPDFRLRSHRGQVRVHFRGSSAKAVARSGISSGDHLLLGLRGAQWGKDSTAATTPGRGIDWELQFGERLVLQILRPSQQPIPLDIDHPTPSPEPPVQTSTPAGSPPHNNHTATSTVRPQLDAQVWASPAFLKRSHFVTTDYNPFAEEEFPDNDRRKRTKFGRGSGQWRFAERTPSPEKEPRTPPYETASPSRMPDQNRPRGEEVQSLVQQAHSTGSPSKASSVPMGALTDRSELVVQAEDDATAKDTSVKEGRGTSTPLSLVNGGGMIQEVTEDENIGNNPRITPGPPHTITDLKEDEVPEERGEVDSSTTRPTSPTSKPEYVDYEVSQKPPHFAQASPLAPIEISSSASSSFAPESERDSHVELDQESDDASDQGTESLFDEQSESGKSNAAIYSGTTSDLGLDGSMFSRPQPPADFDRPSNVNNRLEEEPEAVSVSTEDAQDSPFPLHDDVEQIESENEDLSIFKDSTPESLPSDDEGSEGDDEILEGHGAAQPRPSVQMPSSDQLESSEAGRPNDEAMSNPAAAQFLADVGESWKAVEIDRDENAAQRSSSSPPSSSIQFQSQESQRGPILGTQNPANAAGLKLIPEQSPADSREGQSPSPNREKEDFSIASDEADTLETCPEKIQADSVEWEESLITRRQKVVLDASISPEDLKITPNQNQQATDHAESVVLLTSKIQRTTVEVIDLESSDEDDISPQNVGHEGLQALVNKKGTEFAPKNEIPAHETPLPLVSDIENEHQTSIHGPSRPSPFPGSTGPVHKPVAVVEKFPPVDNRSESETREEAFEPKEDSRKQSPVARIEGYQEEPLLTKAAPLQPSQEAVPQKKECELPSEEEAYLKQSTVAETELKSLLIDELPSTVPDSFGDITSTGQLLTPSSTQRTNRVSQPSSVSFHSTPEDDTLPTPRLTQGTSAGILPPQPLAPPEEPTLTETPAPPKKTSALIERLKEMRRLSSQSPKPRSSDASILDPWFAPKRPSQIVPDSEDESEAESSPEAQAHADIPKTVSRQLPQTPEKPLAKSFIRSPLQPQHISSIQLSPQYLPPSQPPPPGFRTNLSYFVPLASLPSHFATTVDILAIPLSSTPVTRATSGPRDYNQSLYITDPSSSSLQHAITTAQIFRPNNRCFPLVEKGDALLLRDFKVQLFEKRPSLLSTESSAWAVFHKGADVQIRGPPVEFGAEERGFARGLWDWWASLDQDARKRFEDAVPEYKKPNGTATTTESKAGENKSNASIKKEIEGLGVDLPGSQTKRRKSMKERSLDLDGVEERDKVHESIEAPKRVLRARGAKGANGRSESARESRFGTVFTGGLGEPDETQESTHELRDGKAYRVKRK